MTKTKLSHVVLVFFLLLTSCNFFLVNNTLAIKAGDANNLIGIRDLLVLITLCVCAVGGGTAPSGGKGGGNALATAAWWVVALAPLGAVCGLLAGGKAIDVGREFVTLASWALAPLLARNIRSTKQLRLIVDLFVLMGCLVSAGVFVETATGMAVHVVTPAGDVLATEVRSTPSGYPVMMLASGVLFARLAAGRRSASWRQSVRLVCWMVILLASLLTQSRTLLVGMVLSHGALLAFIRPKRLLRPGVLAAIGAAVTLSIGATFAVGELYIRPDFQSYYENRYSVLFSPETAQSYRDPRSVEAELAMERLQSSPEALVHGAGFGTQFRESSEGRIVGSRDGAGVFAHNIWVYFGAKFGLPGIVVFTLFAYQLLKSFLRAMRDSSPLGTAGKGLGVGMLNLLVCAWFGNVFAQAYNAQIAVVGLGCFIAYERLRERGCLARPATESFRNRNFCRYGREPLTESSRCT